MKSLYITLAISAMLIFAACRNDPFKVNVSSIQAEISLTRFENDLFTADPAALEDYIPGWREQYGTFFQHFCYILKLGSADDPYFMERLRQFVTDQHNYRIFLRTR